MRRYSFFLKDGRTAVANGVRLDPNVDRLFQGQTRNFVVLRDGEIETAVLLSGELIGWTIEETEAAPRPASTNGFAPEHNLEPVANGHTPHDEGDGAEQTGARTPVHDRVPVGAGALRGPEHDPLRALLDS